jgi:hypothetical protein
MNPLSVSCEDFRRITHRPPSEATAGERRAVDAHYLGCRHCQEYTAAEAARLLARFRETLANLIVALDQTAEPSHDTPPQGDG